MYYLTFLNVLEALIFNGMALCCFMIPYLKGSASVFNFTRNYNKRYFLLKRVGDGESGREEKEGE